MLPGRENVAHVSLFLLFFSFLNFGTRRNLAPRLRFEKSVSGPLETDGQKCLPLNVFTLPGLVFFILPPAKHLEAVCLSDALGVSLSLTMS